VFTGRQRGGLTTRTIWNRMHWVAQRRGGWAGEPGGERSEQDLTRMAEARRHDVKPSARCIRARFTVEMSRPVGDRAKRAEALVWLEGGFVGTRW